MKNLEIVVDQRVTPLVRAQRIATSKRPEMAGIAQEIDDWRKAIASARTVNLYHETLLNRLKMLLFQEVELLDQFQGEPRPTISTGGKNSREIVNPKFHVLQKIRERIASVEDHLGRVLR